jgi:hypothetical protein
MSTAKQIQARIKDARKVAAECRETLASATATLEDKHWALIGLDECEKFFANL